jgi:predicted nucleic acid-binding protein
MNLALKAEARLIVSRDRHLLVLADPARKEGRDFQIQFPTLRILDPVELLRELEPPLETGQRT